MAGGMFAPEPKRLAIRHDGTSSLSSLSSFTSSNGHGYLPSHTRPSLGAHINKDRLTSRSPAFEKPGGVGGGWTSTWIFRLPGGAPRRIILPIPPGTASVLRRHLSLRPRTTLVALFVGLLLVVNTLVVVKRIVGARTTGVRWDRVLPASVAKSDTCVFPLKELRDLYAWEVQSGNYPTRRRIPPHVGIPSDLYNPSVPLLPSPPRTLAPPAHALSPEQIDNATQPTGPSRTYTLPSSPKENLAYPPRPVKGSVADLDIIHAYCDYNTGQYVRDCLEVLKVGAGLDNSNRMRRGNLDKWSYIYTEGQTPQTRQYGTAKVEWREDLRAPAKSPLRKLGPQRLNLTTLSPMPSVPQSERKDGSCDPSRPRIFHMYWSGPFTDKPYLTLMSYLYTQPLGLHLPYTPSGSPSPLNLNVHDNGAGAGCRPEFWVWINPGPSASVPNPHAKDDMFDTLSENPWSAPFLHKRFHDVVKFKMWNTTERLDAHPELEGWREHGVLGKLAVEPDLVLKLEDAKKMIDALDESASQAGVTEGVEGVVAKAGGNVKAGSKAEAAMVQLKAADAAQVVMSDLARFLVTHAYGGCYLDVDNVLLRDWEELWGWRGAFAMRWSVHEWYNTAVLRMHADSALGRFLLKTAMASTSDIPFHPFTITNYVDDARLAPVLMRIPDALFDPNFLAMEGKQRERPPFPSFSWDSRFEEFFVSPARAGAEGGSAGFEGFYRGAYSYHWHNNWEKPVDAGRNFPDLGPKFSRGEKVARTRHVATLRAKALAAAAAGGGARVKQDRDGHTTVSIASGAAGGEGGRTLEEEERESESRLWEDSPENDERDLSWSAVLKRTFEAYVRGERPNMYGEWMVWE